MDKPAESNKFSKGSRSKKILTLILVNLEYLKENNQAHFCT